MPPGQAAQEIAAMAAEVFPLLSDEERLWIIVGMTGGQAKAQGEDKVSSMVHL
jgi:H+/Cl- antiporter ClcA